MWEHCGMARNEAGLSQALERDPRAARGVLARRQRARAAATQLNQELEKANRVADFLELGELMCWTRWSAQESCGGHFREEHQTPDGEAMRDDEHFGYVRPGSSPGRARIRVLHKEPLEFEYVHPSQRSYE